MTAPALSVCLRAADSAWSAVTKRLASELEKAGLVVHRTAPSEPPCDHIVVTGPGSGPTLRIDTASATTRTLVLVTAPAPPGAHQLWALRNAGADDVLWWPPESGARDALLARLRRWEAVRRMQLSPLVCRSLVGASHVWQRLVREVVEVAAFSQSTVLITGETGTGKDLIAHLIHQLGGGQGDLTILDCTTLSPELAGSELFGHERGAFTGAQAGRDGAFAMAHGGTLFLDEVGELPLPLQAQLLRVLQEHQYKRVGSNCWQSSQFRLVCATNRDLESEVARGAFRADLYYRIAAWRCRPPPLRERTDDILPLTAHFLRQLAPAGATCELDAAVCDYLQSRDYPGNVRDLRQTVARIWHRHCGTGTITVGALAAEPPRCGASDTPASAWPDREFEQGVRHALSQGLGLARISQCAADLALRIVLQEEGGNNQRAALRLGVTDRALQIRRKAQLDATPDQQA